MRFHLTPRSMTPRRCDILMETMATTFQIQIQMTLDALDML